MISREVCQRVLQKAVSTGADYAEIFAENTVNHNISMIANKVDGIKDTVISGAAIRVYKDLRSVMASTVDMTEAGLMKCAESAAEALGQGNAQIDIVLKERIFGDIHPVKIVPSSCGNAEKNHKSRSARADALSIYLNFAFLYSLKYSFHLMKNLS